MNYGPLIFLAAFFALASSWFGLVLTPQTRLGHLQQTNAVGTGASYPLARPGLAAQGAQVYRANGCAYCHSQQVRQTGTVCDVVLATAGTNEPALLRALLTVAKGVSEAEARQWLTSLPKTIRSGITRQEADAVRTTLKVGGAKSELWVRPVGPDLERGWGKRRSVAEDFLYDYPVMPGSQRIGPDLANIGVRQPDANWHLRHLYAPQNEVKGSTMPPYRFLFEKRKKALDAAGDALALPANLAPPPEFEIVPRPEAKALVAYLLSLSADAPLFVAPVTVASAIPATAATNAPATNDAAATVPPK